MNLFIIVLYIFFALCQEFNNILFIYYTHVREGENACDFAKAK